MNEPLTELTAPQKAILIGLAASVPQLSIVVSLVYID